MPTPKSPIKVLYKEGKTEVVYTDRVDASQYYLYELNRGALRDVAKFVATKFAEKIMAMMKSREKRIVVDKKGNAKEKPNTDIMKKQIAYNVWSSKKTKYPKVEIAFNPKQNTGFNALWEETGNAKNPKEKRFLTNVVNENIAEIIKIESQYLTALNGNESTIESMINEEEIEGEGAE